MLVWCGVAQHNTESVSGLQEWFETLFLSFSYIAQAFSYGSSSLKRLQDGDSRQRYFWLGQILAGKSGSRQSLTGSDFASRLGGMVRDRASYMIESDFSLVWGISDFPKT